MPWLECGVLVLWGCINLWRAVVVRKGGSQASLESGACCAVPAEAIVWALVCGSAPPVLQGEEEVVAKGGGRTG